MKLHTNAWIKTITAVAVCMMCAACGATNGNQASTYYSAHAGGYWSASNNASGSGSYYYESYEGN